MRIWEKVRGNKRLCVVSEQLTTRLLSSFLDKPKKYLINERGMESREQILKEKRLLNRLHLAATRVKDVERECILAIATAHSEGLSIREIAKATGLSSSRVHQLLHTALSASNSWLAARPARF